jgi:hypothetical protein
MKNGKINWILAVGQLCLFTGILLSSFGIAGKELSHTLAQSTVQSENVAWSGLQEGLSLALLVVSAVFNLIWLFQLKTPKRQA